MGEAPNWTVRRATVRRGLAAVLLERVVQYAREAGAKSVSLRASAAGRPVYERWGFAGDPSFMSYCFADGETPG